jgi:hypothetical protein
MKELRKIGDIWKAVDDQRKDFKMSKYVWNKSFEGVKAVIKYIGLTMITTKEELDAMEIPMEKNGTKRYSHRKIDVSKNGIISKSCINSILSGNNGLRTKAERDVIFKNVGILQSISQPKGISTTNNKESKAIDNLNILIGISDYIHSEHLFENRLYDMAYCMIGDDINEKVFVADQVKSSRVGENGCVYFSGSNGMLTVGDIISILENGSLTCIGKNQDNKVDVVWFFNGIDNINVLQKFNTKKTFNQILHPKVKSSNEFTLSMNDPLIRFNIGKSSEECHRLHKKKLEYIKIGIKHSLTFWNEDDSQIPLLNHRIEQRSFNMTRNSCKNINIKVERVHNNSYGPVDFIVNGIVKIQDKAPAQTISIRGYGKLPYNPNDIDIFQVSDLVNNTVYAIPMRVMTNEIVTSFFTSEYLMKTSVYFGPKWKEEYKHFKYELKTSDNTLSYVNACENANKIPQLTDRDFYKNMVDKNKDKFGSRKQLSNKI